MICSALTTMSENDLERLLGRCRHSDGAAWRSLVTRFEPLVYSVPRRFGLDGDDAADVFGATFSSLLRSLDRIESAQALPRWLAVTAARESLRRIRAKGGDRFVSLDEAVAWEEATAERDAIAAERAESLHAAVEELPDRCRLLLRALYFEDEAEYAAISARLGMPLGAIGPTRARCLEKLRVLLLREGWDAE